MKVSQRMSLRRVWGCATSAVMIRGRPLFAKCRELLDRFTNVPLDVASFILGDTDLAMGIVKWFNPTKGYGFIQPEGGGPDVFVHISAVEKAGYTNLAEGARISYELAAGRSGKMSAENLRVG